MGTLYENIKELCEEKGIAPSNFGAEITGSKAFMTELKKGRKKGVSAETTKKIADYFGVSVDRVLYGKREDPEAMNSDVSELAGYLEDLRSRPETRTLLDAARGMTKEQVELMANFAKSIRGENR